MNIGWDMSFPVGPCCPYVHFLQFRRKGIILKIETNFNFYFPDYMQSLCKNHFLQQLYRKIDGAVLWSQNERNLDCIITFQTHSVLQRFMLRFDMLQLDCNDHLLVYDGAHAVSTPKVSQWNRIENLCSNYGKGSGALKSVLGEYKTRPWESYVPHIFISQMADLHMQIEMPAGNWMNGFHNREAKGGFTWEKRWSWRSLILNSISGNLNH